MANLTLLRDPGCDVIRIGSALKILEMARHTHGRRQIEVSVGMALVALQFRVSTRKRETDRIVIETGRLPGGSRMAILTSLRKP